MNAPSHNRLDLVAPETERDSVASAPGAGPLDAPPSNRASNRCNEGRFEILSRHVDSLELSFPGEISFTAAQKLEQLKERAQSRDPSVRAQAQIVLAGRCLEVRDKGAGMFPYVLQDDRFYIKLSRQGNKSLPLAFCQIRNRHLMSVGAVSARADLLALLAELGQVTGPETVSRVDLAVDFVSDQVMDAWGREAWVTRLAYKQSHSVGDRFTGWSIGRKNTLQFGLYDKTFEIEQESGKDYLYEVWEKSGWAPWDTVWRAEGRFRRSVLAQFGLDTLEEVLGSLGCLWRYLTETSIRLTEPSQTDATRARWPNLGLWDQLSQIAWGMPAGVLTRVYKGLGAPKDRTLAIRAISTLTSLMARDGVLDTGPAWSRLRDVVWSYLLTREIATGLRPEEALVEKAQEKGRRYGTLQNVSGAPALPPPGIPAAQAYRRASGGG